jgi:hypothetical protein
MEFVAGSEALILLRPIYRGWRGEFYFGNLVY